MSRKTSRRKRAPQRDRQQNKDDRVSVGTEGDWFVVLPAMAHKFTKRRCILCCPTESQANEIVRLLDKKHGSGLGVAGALSWALSLGGQPEAMSSSALDPVDRETWFDGLKKLAAGKPGAYPSDSFLHHETRKWLSELIAADGATRPNAGRWMLHERVPPSLPTSARMLADGLADVIRHGLWLEEAISEAQAFQKRYREHSKLWHDLFCLPSHALKRLGPSSQEYRWRALSVQVQWCRRLYQRAVASCFGSIGAVELRMCGVLGPAWGVNLRLALESASEWVSMVRVGPRGRRLLNLHGGGGPPETFRAELNKLDQSRHEVRAVAESMIPTDAAVADAVKTKNRRPYCRNPRTGTQKKGRLIQPPRASGIKDSGSHETALSSEVPKFKSEERLLEWKGGEIRFGVRQGVLCPLAEILFTRPNQNISYATLTGTGGPWQGRKPEYKSIVGAITRLKRRIAGQAGAHIAAAIHSCTQGNSFFIRFDATEMGNEIAAK